jgi:hypothetical protein
MDLAGLYGSDSSTFYAPSLNSSRSTSPSRLNTLAVAGSYLRQSVAYMEDIGGELSPSLRPSADAPRAEMPETNSVAREQPEAGGSIMPIPSPPVPGLLQRSRENMHADSDSLRINSLTAVRVTVPYRVTKEEQEIQNRWIEQYGGFRDLVLDKKQVFLQSLS